MRYVIIAAILATSACKESPPENPCISSVRHLCDCLGWSEDQTQEQIRLCIEGRSLSAEQRERSDRLIEKFNALGCDEIRTVFHNKQQ